LGQRYQISSAGQKGKCIPIKGGKKLKGASKTTILGQNSKYHDLERLFSGNPEVWW
jgi:hypothetical protein